MIADGIEESLQVEYKSAGALSKQNNSRDEITKDISAMANSVGGTVIYGIAEFKDAQKRHLPEKLDPIVRQEFPREWLEQVIQTIQPRIDGVVIHSVDDADPSKCFYVVEIPQSSTVHQARDHKYYKRYNFNAVSMEDYEVRDVMNRRKHSYVSLSFELGIYTPQATYGGPSLGRKEEDELWLNIRAINAGPVYAQFVVALVDLPVRLLSVHEIIQRGLTGGNGKLNIEDLAGDAVFTRTNQQQDKGYMGKPLSDKRYEPILPSLDLSLGGINLRLKSFEMFGGDAVVRWKVHADNAPVVSGSVPLSEVSIVDNRKRK